MKNTIFALFIIAIISSASIRSYGQQADPKSAAARENMKNAKSDMADAKQNLKDAKKDSLDQYPKFKKESMAKFKSNDKKIAQLKAKDLNMKEEDKAIYRNKVEALEKKNTDLKMKLSDYKNDKGREEFIAFKNDFNSEMDRVVSAIVDLSINYKKTQ